MAALLIVWLLPPTRAWFEAFVKLEPMRVPYTAMFFALLLVALVLLANIIVRGRALVAPVVGAVLGQLAAMLSIFAANLFIPDGLHRTIQSAMRDRKSVV